MNWFEFPTPDPKREPAEFSDVDGARNWLSRQPLAMPARLQAVLAEQLERLAGTNLPAFKRATLLETLRNATVTAQNAARRRFAFAGRPLAGDAAEAFALAARLWTALATGYLQCFQAFASEAASKVAGADRQLLATAAHRALITCRIAIEDHFVAGVEAPEVLWFRLQRLIQAAVTLGIADLRIADPEFRDPAESSPADQYVLAALQALVDPYRWNSAGFTVAHRSLSRWRTQVRLCANNDADPKLRWVPLSAVAPLPDAGDAASPAWLEVHQLRRKLRKRIEALDAGESPEALHLGRELSGPACRELLDAILDHLRAAYSDAREKTTPVDSECELAVGPAGAFELLANRPFVGGQTLTSASSRILHERVAMFGTAERVESVRPQERNTSGERWRLVGESVQVAKLARPLGDSGARMLPGQLVVFRDSRGSASLAIVTRAWTRRDGRSEITLRRLPGKPEALTARAADLQTEPDFPAFLLPDVAAVGSSASLLLPTGIASRLKYGIEVRGEVQMTCRLGRLIERGADFERYAYAER